MAIKEPKVELRVLFRFSGIPPTENTSMMKKSKTFGDLCALLAEQRREALQEEWESRRRLAAAPIAAAEGLDSGSSIHADNNTPNFVVPPVYVFVHVGPQNCFLPTPDQTLEHVGKLLLPNFATEMKLTLTVIDRIHQG